MAKIVEKYKGFKIKLTELEELALEEKMKKTGLSFPDLIRARCIRDEMPALIRKAVDAAGSGTGKGGLIRFKISHEEGAILNKVCENTGLDAGSLFKYALFGRNIIARKDEPVETLKLREARSLLSMAKDNADEGTLVEPHEISTLLATLISSLDEMLDS